MSHPQELPAPLVFFTGAGISVGAGLPTYRGTGGLYESGKLQPPTADDAEPERLPALWDRFRPRLRAYDELRPALAHRAIAELERSIPGGVTVVTQNVDGLHSLAGSSRVIELHGSLRSVRCLDHQHVHDLDDAAWVDGEAPRCPTCGAMCRPNIVLFGESLPVGAFHEADVAMRRARSVVAVGTSAVVYPAAFLIGAQYTEGTTCVWVNPETPPPDSTWSWRRGSADAEIGSLLSGL
jgi:NAD-dependent deacetylase